MQASESDTPESITPDELPSDSEPDTSVSRAAIYARTSESKSDQQYSIDEQVRRCWERCQNQDWDVEFVFTDQGETGTNTERSGFQEMLEKAESGYFDVVVFWKLDRFCRSVIDLVNTKEQLGQYDVALQSVTEYIDTASPVGRFTFRNLASAAELESDLTSQRVQIGMRGMAKEHRWPNSNPPFGYDLNDDQKLEVNEKEAQLVTQIFNIYLEVKSMPDVAQDLNERGLRTKQGNKWTQWAVKTVLTNELYCGQYQLGDYEEYVEEYRILSDELFEAVTNTRYRFKHQKGSMDKSRKELKASKVLDEFKTAKERTE